MTGIPRNPREIRGCILENVQSHGFIQIHISTPRLMEIGAGQIGGCLDCIGSSVKCEVSPEQSHVVNE